MEEYSYTLDTECDWCEETKKCRYLYQGDIPVLAICEDCDSHPEFPMNIVEKETTMNTCDFCETQVPKVTTIWAKNRKDSHLYPLSVCDLCLPKMDQRAWTTVAPNFTNTNNKESTTMNINDGPIPGDIASDGHRYIFTEFRDDSIDNCKIHTTEHADCCPCNESTTPNTNTKENAMNNTTSPICEVAACKSTGKYHLLVWASAFNAYALDQLPLPYQGGTWQEVEMDFCGTHKNVLHRGNAVQLKLAVNPVVSYDLTQPEQRELFNVEVLGGEVTPTNTTTKEEDTMDITTKTIEELEDYLADLFETGAEISRMGSFAYETEEDYQADLAELTDEFNKVEALIIQKKKEQYAMSTTTTKQILCGHCKGYHHTPAEVAECYGVTRKTTFKTSTPLVKEYQHSTSQWFATKQEAIKFLKGLGDITKGMRPAKNGHGFWVWMKKS